MYVVVPGICLNNLAVGTLAAAINTRKMKRNWTVIEMATNGLTAKKLKRLDAMLALPLAGFRRHLAELSPEELSALEARAAVQMMRNRLALGGHGMARHRAHGELGLLERRRAAMRLERELRGASADSSLRLVEQETNLVILPASVPEGRAA